MVARHIATTLSSGSDRAKTIQEAAAWLKSHGKARQVSYLANDIAVALAESGYLFVEFYTARPVNEATKTALKKYISDTTDAKEIECEFKLDEKLIGGVLIHTPYGSLDASVRARLAKIVEGASR